MLSFATLGDVFKPKSFAGLFGAAPSIALATIVPTVAKQGRAYVAIEARSMLFGAGSFLLICRDCVSCAVARQVVSPAHHLICAANLVCLGPRLVVCFPAMRITADLSAVTRTTGPPNFSAITPLTP